MSTPAQHPATPRTLRSTLALIGAWVLAAVAALVTAGCTQGQQVVESSTMGSNGRVGEILLRNVYVEQPIGGQYEPGEDATTLLTLLNESEHPDELVAVTTPQAREVQLYWDRNCDGVAEAVPSIPLQPEGGVPPGPGQRETGLPPYFLQVIDLEEVTRGGTLLPLTFFFERAGEVTVQAKVQVPGDAAIPPTVSQCPIQP